MTMANENPEDEELLKKMFMDGAANSFEDDEEFAFKDTFAEGEKGHQSEKRAKTEAQFQDFMQFLAQ